MKKAIYLLCSLLLAVTFYACSDDDNDYRTVEVAVELTYPEGAAPMEGVVISLKNTTNDISYEAKTDAEGKALFNVPAGIYQASATDTRVDGAEVLLYNGLNSQITVSAESVVAKLGMVASSGGSLVIKELYVGGCPKDDGSGTFAFDQSVVLYNNSSATIDLSDVVLGMVLPYNAESANKDYVNGALTYEAEGWVPAGMAVWYFSDKLTLEPGKQVVVVHTGAIDNTVTYSQSINYANPDYYCCYDPESGLNHTKYYPAPSEVIPTGHYLKTYKYGMGNAWPLSQISPAFFIFRPEGTDLKSFINDESTTDNYGGSTTQVRKKVPVEWVVDGVEVFKAGADDSQKRLTASIDAGSVLLTNKLGHTLYRNVNKEATEALPENEGKLVYGYAGGADASTDPSGIDAEASLKKGARIIYQDTNNSANDFHERAKSSLRN